LKSNHLRSGRHGRLFRGAYVRKRPIDPPTARYKSKKFFDDVYLTMDERIELYHQAILEGWDVPKSERPIIVKSLVEVIKTGKEHNRVAAFQALSAILDKQLSQEDRRIKWAAIENAKKTGIEDLPDCQAKDETGQPLDP
jgi:hypothetical protein